MKIMLDFTEKEIDYLREKFEIADEEDLAEAVWQMIETYMELD